MMRSIKQLKKIMGFVYAPAPGSKSHDFFIGPGPVTPYLQTIFTIRPGT